MKLFKESSIVLSIALLTAIFTSSCSKDDSTPPAVTLKIENIEDLKEFRDLINEEGNYNATLMANIDLSAEKIGLQLGMTPQTHSKGRLMVMVTLLATLRYLTHTAIA